MSGFLTALRHGFVPHRTTCAVGDARRDRQKPHRCLGWISLLQRHMTKAKKRSTKQMDLSSRVFSRGLMIRICDFRPPIVSKALPCSPVGSGFMKIWQFLRGNYLEEEKLAKVSNTLQISVAYWYSTAKLNLV